jgi:alginate O-acetyltransferase complex protein AlgI
MVFSDLFFLFAFLPAFALCYLAGSIIDKKCSATTASNSVKNLVLVAFSLIFYAWGEPVYVFLMLACVFINYLIGLGINASQGKRRKWALGLGVAANVGIIGLFKYAGFIAQTLTDCGLDVKNPNIALPIGISFYTFQSISYLIDVYRKDSPVQKNFSGLLLYISMFPQLIAGPIVRYGTVAEEIHNRHVSAKDFAEGSFRFLIGLGKKVIFANQLSEVSDQFLVNGVNDLSAAGAWVGILAFSMQIYFDFSGYSDMAIGMGRCMGFHFNENFNHPYCCNSITDFWRRWHMSLGSFFRDYVYIPMGGNRRHQAFNIMVVWFLTGMWHGASWNFIIWGVYFGIIIMAEKYTLLKVHNRIPRPLLHIYSLLLVVVGWGIFYFDDFSQMKVFFNAFFGNSANADTFIAETALTDKFWLWVAAVIFCLPLRSAAVNLTERMLPRNSTLKETVYFVCRTAVSVAIVILCVALLVGATNNAFIYTRF